MGYSYGQNPLTGRWMLSCDSCGDIGGVRKRTCPHKVLSDSHRSPSGQRYPMAYCYPSALCKTCYADNKATLHADCAAGAAASQAKYDAIEEGLDAGRLRVVAAYGSWHEDVPEGSTMVTFSGRAGANEVTVLVPQDDYHPGQKPWLDQYEFVAVGA